MKIVYQDSTECEISTLQGEEKYLRTNKFRIIKSHRLPEEQTSLKKLDHFFNSWKGRMFFDNKCTCLHKLIWISDGFLSQTTSWFLKRNLSSPTHLYILEKKDVIEIVSFWIFSSTKIIFRVKYDSNLLSFLFFPFSGDVCV